MGAFGAIGIILCLMSAVFGVPTFCDWRETSGKFTCILYNGFFKPSDEIFPPANDSLVLRVEVAGPASKFVLNPIVKKFTKMQELIVENGIIEALDINSTSFVQNGVNSDQTELKVLKLSNVKLNALPERPFHLFVNLMTLDLSKNLISSMHATADEGLGNLETLILDDNQLLKESNAFQATSLKKLKIFSIAGNELPLIPASIPSKTTLVKIDLSRNLITAIADNFFTGFPALEELNLDQNKIKALHNDFFSSLTLLKVLNVASNEIQSFEFLRKATKLEHLNIASQMPKIKSLNATMLAENKELKVFNASHNEIAEIYNSLFHNAEKITTLDLRNNRIERIEGGFVNYIKNINATLLSCNKCISKNYYTKPGEKEFEVCNSSSSMIVSAALVLISITAVKLF